MTQVADHFIGRAAELEATDRALAALRDGWTAPLAIEGEPGIGKTRLAQELSTRLGRSAQVLEGHCAPDGEGSAYAPFAEMVRAVRELDPLEARLAGDPDASA